MYFAVGWSYFASAHCGHEMKDKQSSSCVMTFRPAQLVTVTTTSCRRGYDPSPPRLSPLQANCCGEICCSVYRYL